MQLNNLSFVVLLLGGIFLQASEPQPTASVSKQTQRAPSPELIGSNDSVETAVKKLVHPENERFFGENLGKLMRLNQNITTPAQVQKKIINAHKEMIQNPNSVGSSIEFMGSMAAYWFLQYEEESKKCARLSRELRQLKAKKQREQSIVDSLDLDKFKELAQQKKERPYKR